VLDWRDRLVCSQPLAVAYAPQSDALRAGGAGGEQLAPIEAGASRSRRGYTRRGEEGINRAFLQVSVSRRYNASSILTSSCPCTPVTVSRASLMPR
jgi:hypothetical protein